MNRFDEWKDAFGTKVIVRSNEDEPLKVGELMGFYPLHDNSCPVVRIEGKDLVCMGIVLPFIHDLHTMLSAQSPKDQWETLRKISLATQIRHRRQKEEVNDSR